MLVFLSSTILLKFLSSLCLHYLSVVRCLLFPLELLTSPSVMIPSSRPSVSQVLILRFSRVCFFALFLVREQAMKGWVKATHIHTLLV